MVNTLPHPGSKGAILVSHQTWLEGQGKFVLGYDQLRDLSSALDSVDGLQIKKAAQRLLFRLCSLSAGIGLKSGTSLKGDCKLNLTILLIRNLTILPIRIQLYILKYINIYGDIDRKEVYSG